ncbi:alpha-ketoacid dehydrogenase subunit beta [Candidatus Woesearchaeota archaeon CG1_02_57_44]|nr:MAG: alpha-ketoacid dehydrogenase subunit beta [Candidatus Woesearchaeota archaeon CG1_02_57_44]
MKMHMVAALNQALDQAMAKDKSVLVMGEDVGVDGGVFRVTEGLYQKYPGRSIDTPLAESAIVGVAVGLALNGMKPICEIQFSGFTYQAFGQIKQHLARFRQRSDGCMTLPMIVRAPCAGGIRALEHHSESPEAFYVHCQGLKVVMPSGPYDAKGLLLASIEDPDPVMFFEPKSIYRAFKEEVPEDYYTIPLGKANLVREGSKLTIVTWGAMLRLVQQTLEANPMDADVIDMRTLAPLDMETVLTSIKKTGRAIVVSEETRAGSMAGDIAARIQEDAIMHLDAPVIRVTSFDIPFPQFALEKYHLPNVKRVQAAIAKVMSY